MKALVPDTNFWLHARRPFDLQAIAGGEQYVVAVPTKVLNELDEKQHEGRRRLRNRARDLVMTFRHVSKGGHTALGRWEGADQEGLTYWFVGDAKVEPGTSADQVIVETARTLKPDAEVVIVTSDDAMEVTARMAGLEVWSVPRDLLEPDELDPLEQDVAALKRQVERLQQPQQLNVQVVAQILFPAGGEIHELMRIGQPSPEQLDDVRKEVQTRLAFNDPAYAASDGVRMYNATVPGYAVKVAEYLAAAARWEALAETGMWVQLLIINRTRTPVQNPILELRAPEHVTFSYPPPKPEPPPAMPRVKDMITPPPATRSSRALADVVGVAAALGNYRVPVLPAIHSAQTRGPWLNINESTVEAKLDEPLRPNYDEFAGKVWLGIGPEFGDVDLEIPFVIYSAAASKPFAGTTTIKLAHQRERWSSPTLPTLDNPRCGEITRVSQRERWVMRDLSRNG